MFFQTDGQGRKDLSRVVINVFFTLFEVCIEVKKKKKKVELIVLPSLPKQAAVAAILMTS